MKKNERGGYDVTYEIKGKIGVIKKGNSGWTKEMNLVDWNEKGTKIDIREWNEDYTKCGRGITLFPDELRTIIEVGSRYLEEIGKLDEEFDEDPEE